MPVYFDFEGTWRNLSGDRGPQRYPQSLGALDPDSVALARDNPATQRGIAALAGKRASGDPSNTAQPAHVDGPATLPKSQRRLLDRGWVHWRIFLDLQRCEGAPGARIEEVMLIHGALRREGAAASLFADLVREGRSYPFLFLSDGRGVVLGGLGARPAPDPGSARALARGRRSIMSILQEHLIDVDVVRERTAHLKGWVDHRYEQAIGRHGES